MAWAVPTALVLGIIAVLTARVVSVLSTERGRRSGTPPGQGAHLLRSEYFSGAGGGEAKDYTVPKDPQAYARLFVPKDKHRR